MKAFKVIVRGAPAGVCFSETAGKARYYVYRSMREIGYAATFADIVIRRGAAYDVLVGSLKRPCHLSLEQIHLLLADQLAAMREASA